MCGEKKSVCMALFVNLGSPPRVRGKALRELFAPARLGITPACAGKRLISWQTTARAGDHPRVCGEKLGAVICIPPFLGSPPRVRGKAPLTATQTGRSRITPACAGKRTMRAASRSTTWDHPRVCGEKLRTTTRRRRRQGSPPRVRGKVADADDAGTVTGITPACAGKSDNSSGVLPLYRDHPRVCGEKTSPRWLHPPGGGSPPRVRGKAH